MGGYWFRGQKSGILALFEAMWPNFARLVAVYAWGETAELIDIALMFWQEQEYPLEVKHRLMTSHLERITERVKSYLRP